MWIFCNNNSLFYTSVWKLARKGTPYTASEVLSSQKSYTKTILFVYIAFYAYINLPVTCESHRVNYSCHNIPRIYSNVEYADMIFVYGFCNDNAMKAMREYARRFSNRRMLNRRVIT